MRALLILGFTIAGLSGGCATSNEFKPGAGTRIGYVRRWAQPSCFVGSLQLVFGPNCNRGSSRTGRRVLPREGAEIRPQIGGWKQDHFRVHLGGPKASVIAIQNEGDAACLLALAAASALGITARAPTEAECQRACRDFRRRSRHT